MAVTVSFGRRVEFAPSVFDVTVVKSKTDMESSTFFGRSNSVR